MGHPEQDVIGTDVVGEATAGLLELGLHYWLAVGLVGQVVAVLVGWRLWKLYQKIRHGRAEKNVIAESGSVSYRQSKEAIPWTVEDARLLRYVARCWKEQNKRKPPDSGMLRVDD